MLFRAETDKRGARVVINVDRGQVQAAICVYETTDDTNGSCQRLADELNAAIEKALHA